MVMINATQGKDMLMNHNKIDEQEPINREICSEAIMCFFGASICHNGILCIVYNEEYLQMQLPAAIYITPSLTLVASRH